MLTSNKKLSKRYLTWETKYKESDRADEDSIQLRSICGKLRKLLKTKKTLFSTAVARVKYLCIITNNHLSFGILF